MQPPEGELEAFFIKKSKNPCIASQLGDKLTLSYQEMTYSGACGEVLVGCITTRYS